MEFPAFFNKCSGIIRDMRLGNLFMAMQMARIGNSRLTASAAGMPSMFIYWRNQDSVEEFLMKGMPLGLHSDFPYRQIETALFPGDTILMMSDGLAETFNGAGEMLDYPRVKETFREAGRLSPTEIIEGLKSTGRSWRGNAPLADDMTFVVVRVKE
jgi:sigma-B regulation protein RsbU (phosphoserine phosphatase)